MRVVIATHGTFHAFDLAREMHKRDWLQAIYTGYPKFKLKNEGIPMERIRSFPWLQTLFMMKGRIGLTNPRFGRELAWLAQQTLSTYEEATLPPCDIFLGFTGVGRKAGAKAQKQGATYVCDRGSSHIRFQDNLLREEYALHKMPFRGNDLRVFVNEEAEYEIADAITVPSTFVLRSFMEMGVPESKITRVPYGVNLSRFYPTGLPEQGRFDVLFVGAVSLRKGIPYLLEAFARLAHPHKQLTIVGAIQPEVQPIIAKYMASDPIHCTGSVPQPELKNIMSRSHVLVLPSIEEGLALVQAQAMACGCPVIGTTNSGAEDLFRDGVEGYVLPIRNSQAITDRLQQLADDPELRSRMSAAALQRVQTLGGWDAYGTAMAEFFSRLRTAYT